MKTAWKQVRVVLRREYVERVKTKGFVISTIAIPVLMLGMMGLSAFMAVRAEQSQRQMALVDFTGQVGEEVAPPHGSGRIRPGDRGHGGRA